MYDFETDREYYIKNIHSYIGWYNTVIDSNEGFDDESKRSSLFRVMYNVIKNGDVFETILDPTEPEYMFSKRLGVLI